MGQIEETIPVLLNAKSLTSHTFITGSTGSGKSNTIYGIISKLWKNYSIPSLIIEPAKGEYKQIFGNDFHVYGTNPDHTELLRINPFKFDKKIHVLEHIERLIDIFNVCWSMYAAMPAVLKKAVELSYTDIGWNLDTSENCYHNNLYPCFEDVLSSLRKVISHSDYSQEVKDNYTGSLITRVESLTNGLYGRIFTSSEIDNSELFEENTIIDLSRVGSSEAKSMIMGIIIMKLQEYHMAKPGINVPLKHLTVLEEAHNILKRTSTEQYSESSNLLGKSVEMISNAIAEMRTYGEGFIIADQSPELLDRSVIRNTNTKIIMHLPDMTDRELVGKAAGLSDDQLIELAKIPAGVAAIYQNQWIEPVLCKIERFSIEPKEYVFEKVEKNNEVISQSFIKGRIAQYLVSSLSKEEPLTDIEQLKKWLVQSNIKSSLKIELLSIFDSEELHCKNVIEKIVTKVVDGNNTVFEKAKNAKDIDSWNEYLLNAMDIKRDDLSSNCINNILECLIHYRSLENTADEENFLKWMDFMGRKVI